MAEDDSLLGTFKTLDATGAVQLRILPAVGAEKFAEYIYNKLQEFVNQETEGRVKVVRVEFMEHGRNTAIYEG
jgi:6-pyruvoyltetrahydropterin/6-carboxytetrahydropterin synthase